MTKEVEKVDLSADEIRAQVRAEMKAQHAKVMALCKLAGMPDRAAGFIAKDMAEADVIAELDALKAEGKDSAKVHDLSTARGRAAARADAMAGKAKAGDAAEVNARNTGNTDEATPVLDPVAIYAKWNRRTA